MVDFIYIRKDWFANRGRPHVQVALVLFRLAQWSRSGRGYFARIVRVPLAAFYRIYALFVLALDIPVSTKIGPGLSIHHCMGLVVHNRAVIGAGVSLRQNTTIGSKRGGGAPELGNGVDVGANAVILGEIAVGHGVIVGAGSVVTKSIPSYSVVAGNPARILRSNHLSFDHERVQE